MHRRQHLVDDHWAWTSNFSRRVLRAITLSSAALWLCGASDTSHAQLFSWTGGGTTNNWSVAANWGGVVPTSGSALLFGNSSNPFPFNNLGTFDLDLIFLAAPTYIISGNPLRFSTSTPELTAQSGSAHVINNDIIIAQPLEVQVNSGINLFLDGDLSGAADITKIQSGLLVLGGSNGSWSGDMNISNGTVRFDGSNPLGNSTVVNVSAGATAEFSAGDEQFGGFAGNGHIEVDGAVEFIPLFSADENFMGTISGASADFRKRGAGTLFLVNNPSIQVDQLNVEQGRIQFTIGSMQVGTSTNVDSGATLDVLSGSFTPGPILTVQGSMTLGQGSSLVPSPNQSIDAVDGGQITVSDGDLGFADTHVNVFNATLTTDTNTTLDNGVFVHLAASALDQSGRMNVGGSLSVDGGALLEVDALSRANIAGGLFVGIIGDGTVLVDGNDDIVSGVVLGGSITTTENSVSSWGAGGNTAELTFQNNAVGTFGHVEMPTFGAAAGTTSTLTLLSGSRVSMQSLTMGTSNEPGVSAQIMVREDSELFVNGDVAIGSVFDLSPLTLEVSGEDARAEFMGETTVFDTGTLSITNGGAVHAEMPVIIQGGALVVDSESLLDIDPTFGGDLINLVGGHVLGAGTIQPGVFFANAGVVAPGDSDDHTLDILGIFTQTDLGTLEIEIGEPIETTFHDQLNVSNGAALDGDLAVALVNSFVPEPADSFVILDSSNLTGFFVNALPGQRLVTTDGMGSFIVNYGAGSTFDPNQVVLSDFLPTFPADFDMDGDVDNTDLAIWEDAYGVNDLADADGDGDSDGEDFLPWQEQFTGSLPLAAATAVPEPATLFLSLAAITPLFSRWRITKTRCATS